MSITLNKIVNTPTDLGDLSSVREQILAAARTAQAANRHDDIVIELDPGAYNLTEPFVLSAEENPELTSLNITLRGKYAQTAKIQSLVRLDGKRFVRAEDKPYFTYQMEKDSEGKYPRFHDLHLNFREIEMTKSPVWRNPDTLSPEERRGEKKKPGFYAPLSIAEPLAAFDIHGSEVMIHIEWQFCVVHAERVDLSDIKEFNGEKYALIRCKEDEMALFCHDCHPELNIGNREVYLRNCPAYIEAKEDTYAYDFENGVLYINPHDKVYMAYHAVEYPLLENLFLISGLENFTLEGITFTGTTSKYICDNIYYSGQANCETRARRLRHAAIVTASMRNLTVKNCAFRDLGGNGVLLTDDTNVAHLADNVFDNIAMCALSVGNPTTDYDDPKNRNYSIRVENNYFHNIAYEYPSALCVYVGMVDTLKILHNTIEGCGYSAFSVGWGWNSVPYSLGEKFNVRNAEIAYNYIHNFMDVLRDGGAIYVLGGNANPRYTPERFNRMHDNYAELDVMRDHSKYGYYCDGSSSNWDVSHSVIVNCARPLFSQWTVASAYTYHNHLHDVYSTTPVEMRSHAPERDSVIYDYHMVKEGREALFEKYPVAKEIMENAGCRLVL